MAGMASDVREGSLLELAPPIRSQILVNLVGDILCYSGANEANISLITIRMLCRELRDQIDDECLTFNYDDMCGMSNGVPGGEREEIQSLNRCIARHSRLRYFECLMRSPAKFRTLVEELKLPKALKCNFVLEFKISFEDVRRLLGKFRVCRLSIIPEEKEGTGEWNSIEAANLRTLCLRGCSDELVRSVVSVCPRLHGLQIVDSRLMSDPQLSSHSLTSLSLTGIANMADEHFSNIIGKCRNLRSLYISKCNISFIAFSLPKLEFLSVTHCRQLTDQCASELVQAARNPSEHRLLSPIQRLTSLG
eukprot:TRINITY_DN21371_c0_g1_i1.p1 TRINITY_DN21371_c0_g1~~TRINITY_DN21371_c0_g1_i1.p1  ORF type:complete len:342 (+),score=24.56 TRINITY_DN21371_c0_g1_i1:109-1026(+)